jgi:hypothetical protein
VLALAELLHLAALVVDAVGHSSITVCIVSGSS